MKVKQLNKRCLRVWKALTPEFVPVSKRDDYLALTQSKNFELRCRLADHINRRLLLNLMRGRVGCGKMQVVK